MKAPPTVTLTNAELQIQSRTREIATRLRGTYGTGGVVGHSPELSRELGRQGLLGITLPQEFGGREGSAVEKYIIAEELLRADLPVGAHWIAERQTAPLILSYGSTSQREEFLPSIVRGECYFSVGMSEPDSGSDLASVSTLATKVPGGWSVNGRKVWMSYGDRNDFAVVLCRTSVEADKHNGLSQLIVDLNATGVSRAPISTYNGRAEFAEVVLDDAFVADEYVLGTVGGGWEQVTSELVYERGGPDRFVALSHLVDLAIQAVDGISDRRQMSIIGEAVLRLRQVRNLSLGTARQVDQGVLSGVNAALTKDIATSLHLQILNLVREVVEVEPSVAASASPASRCLADAIFMTPIATLAGGTTEILRTMAGGLVLAETR